MSIYDFVVPDPYSVPPSRPAPIPQSVADAHQRALQITATCTGDMVRALVDLLGTTHENVHRSCVDAGITTGSHDDKIRSRALQVIQPWIALHVVVLDLVTSHGSPDDPSDPFGQAIKSLRDMADDLEKNREDAIRAISECVGNAGPRMSWWLNKVGRQGAALPLDDHQNTDEPPPIDYRT